MKQGTKTEFQIIRDGKHTICFGVHRMGEIEIPFAGASSKHNLDKENPVRGEALAMGRAFRNLGRNILKVEYDTIYNQYPKKKEKKDDNDMHIEVKSNTDALVNAIKEYITSGKVE